MKKKLFIVAMISSLIFMAGCGEKRVSMSKSLYVVNNTDTTLVSLRLNVEDNPLDKDIEVLEEPIEPYGYRELIISLPEKQAKNGEWTVLPITEKGEEYSTKFEFGDLNPHGDSPAGFYIQWFGDEESGHYSAGASFSTLEDFITTEDDVAEEIYLVYDERYLLFGDENYGYAIFYEDGNMFMEMVNGDLNGHYTIEGNEIICTLDNGEEEGDLIFTFLDSDNLQWDAPDNEEPIMLIRE